MSRMNLLYLARLTDRVPILPRFRPVHLQGNGSSVDFSDVFDIGRLRKELKTPILEWHLGSENVEDLGCWDVQSKIWEADSAALEPPVELNLDTSYTPIPHWVRGSIEMDQADRSMYPRPLASLVAFNKRATSSRALPTPALSPLHQKAQAPDDQLFCCNSLYFDFTVQLLEARQDISPEWQGVGRHMYVQNVVENHTRQTLGLTPEERKPPNGVHPPRRLRTAMQTRWRPLRTTVSPHCPRTSVASKRCTHRLWKRSDEADPPWWEPVYKLGCPRPNYTETIALYGPLRAPYRRFKHRLSRYPTFIDAVIHSAAYGFVGTDTSTASILARRQVSSKGDVDPYGQVEKTSRGRMIQHWVNEILRIEGVSGAYSLAVAVAAPQNLDGAPTPPYPDPPFADMPFFRRRAMGIVTPREQQNSTRTISIHAPTLYQRPDPAAQKRISLSTRAPRSKSGSGTVRARPVPRHDNDNVAQKQQAGTSICPVPYAAVHPLPADHIPLHRLRESCQRGAPRAVLDPARPRRTQSLPASQDLGGALKAHLPPPVSSPPLPKADQPQRYDSTLMRQRYRPHTPDGAEHPLPPTILHSVDPTSRATTSPAVAPVSQDLDGALTLRLLASLRRRSLRARPSVPTPSDAVVRFVPFACYPSLSTTSASKMREKEGITRRSTTKKRKMHRPNATSSKRAFEDAHGVRCAREADGAQGAALGAFGGEGGETCVD
ncbi:hypothetical protein MSAN_01595300 [Mycena sanguinolenta]|uniref:Uncharacterized protein n=1 Tax=Mycena sanguinolenta TaxID=230812 RepID=A0A8H7CXB7_9AGAR|nr:hypothetical protein MSAN_01595300 [Mycena sanguinolenta]